MASPTVTVGQLLISSEHEEPKVEKCRRSWKIDTSDGESSYTRNSATVQGGILCNICPNLAEAISHLAQPEDGNIRVADLGCSVSSNGLAWADLVAMSVRTNYHRKYRALPEIQHFFFDLPSNNFNTFFRMLAATDATNKYTKPNEEIAWRGERPYLVTAVAGSILRTLVSAPKLAQCYLSVVFALDLQDPRRSSDKSSPAYNKGRVCVDGGSPQAARAYAKVSREDLQNSFTHRAHELAPGGLLFLMLMCRADHDKPEFQTSDDFAQANPCSALPEGTWEELVAEGLIEPQQRDSFNIPSYHPSIEKITEAIDETSAYDIKRLEWRDHIWLPKDSKQAQDFMANPE